MDLLIELFQQAINKNDLKELESLCQQLLHFNTRLNQHNLRLNTDQLNLTSLDCTAAHITAQTALSMASLFLKSANEKSQFLLTCYLNKNLTIGEALIANGYNLADTDRKSPLYKKIDPEFRKTMEARLALEEMKQALLFPKWRPLTDPVKDAMHKSMIVDSQVLATFLNEITQNLIPNPFDAKQWEKLIKTLESLNEQTADVTKRLNTLALAKYSHPELKQVHQLTLSPEQKSEIQVKATSIIKQFNMGLTQQERETVTRYLQMTGPSSIVNDNNVLVAAKDILDTHHCLYEFNMNSPLKLASGLQSTQADEARNYFRENCLLQMTQEAPKKPRFQMEKQVQLTRFLINNSSARDLHVELVHAGKSDDPNKMKTLIALLKKEFNDAQMHTPALCVGVFLSAFANVDEKQYDGRVVKISAVLPALYKTIDAYKHCNGFYFWLDISQHKTPNVASTILVMLALFAENMPMFEYFLEYTKREVELDTHCIMLAALALTHYNKLDYFTRLSNDARFNPDAEIGQHSEKYLLLDVAVGRGSLGILKLLVSRNSPDEYVVEHLLNIAAAQGQLECLDYLLSLDPRRSYPSTVLNSALGCEINNVVMINALLTNNRVEKPRDCIDIYTARHLATTCEIDNRLDLLLRAGLLTKQTVQEALSMAMTIKKPNSIDMILRLPGANLNEAAESWTRGEMAKRGSPIMIAAKQCNAPDEIAQFKSLCAKNKIDCSIIDNDGYNLILASCSSPYSQLEILTTILKADLEFTMPLLEKTLNSFVQQRDYYKNQTNNYSFTEKTVAIELHFLKQKLNNDTTAVELLFADESHLLKHLPALLTSKEPIKQTVLDRAKAMKPLLVVINALTHDRFFVFETQLFSSLQESVHHAPELLLGFITAILTKTASDPFDDKQWDKFVRLVDKLVQVNTKFSSMFSITSLKAYRRQSNQGPVGHTLVPELSAIRESSASSNSTSIPEIKPSATVLSADILAAIDSIVRGEIENLLEAKPTADDLMKIFVFLEETKEDEAEFLLQQQQRTAARKILYHAHSDQLLKFLETPELLHRAIISTQKDMALSIYKERIKVVLNKAIADLSPAKPVEVISSPTQATLLTQLSSVFVPQNTPESGPSQNLKQEVPRTRELAK